MGLAEELEAFFNGYPKSRSLFDALRGEVEALGQVALRVGKSQVAFQRKRNFAFAWIPERYLKGQRELAPLVLTLGLRHKNESPRWKEIVEPHPGRFTHHLELRESGEIDEEVRNWLREAWELAG